MTLLRTKRAPRPIEPKTPETTRTTKSVPRMPPSARVDAPARLSLADPAYEKALARDKSQALWQATSEHPYEKLPDLNSAGMLGGGVFGALRSIGQLFRFKTLGQTFDSTADVREPRSKLFHPFGAVAMVNVEPVASPYRGLLAQHSTGAMRLSLATPTNVGFTPGLALKLLEDGQPSHNLVAIHGLTGEPTRNFFSSKLSTTIAKPTSLPVRAIAWVTSFVADPFVRQVSPDVAHVAGRAPARLDFVPSAAVSRAAPGAADFRSELSGIPAGTPLYDVYAVDAAGDRTLISHVKSKTAFVASEFGDQTLFFQHRR